MRKLLLFFILVAALVFVALPYFVLPAVLENLVARDVRDRLGLDRAPAVNLDSDPQWEMLRGEFSDGRITADNFDIGGACAESASIDVDEPFDIDMVQSVRERVVVPEGPLSGRLRLEISEGEVSRLARANAEMPINRVDLGRNGVTVESEAAAFGTEFPVTVEGDVGVDGGSLVFSPRSIEAAGTEIPGFIAEGLLAGTGFSYPVDDLPYGGRVTGARTTDGAVVITGRVQNVDLGAVAGG